MVIARELIYSLVSLVNILFTVLYWMLVIRIVLSWFGVNPYTSYNELLGALFHVTDLLLKPFRKLPLALGPIDLSPIVAFIALQLLQRVITLLLYRLAGL